jgi:hypothetical protein
MAGPIVVTGPTGFSKTSWVAAHTTNPFIIKSLEDVRHCDPGFNDLLIFDDVSFR